MMVVVVWCRLPFCVTFCHSRWNHLAYMPSEWQIVLSVAILDGALPFEMAQLGACAKLDGKSHTNRCFGLC